MKIGALGIRKASGDGIKMLASWEEAEASAIAGEMDILLIGDDGFPSTEFTRDIVPTERAADGIRAKAPKVKVICLKQA